jgi:hypothetical protein
VYFVGYLLAAGTRHSIPLSFDLADPSPLSNSGSHDRARVQIYKCCVTLPLSDGRNKVISKEYYLTAL